LNLAEVDSLEVLVLVDNVSDSLSSNPPVSPQSHPFFLIARRPSAAEGR
jgi:hypothetical protein